MPFLAINDEIPQINGKFMTMGWFWRASDSDGSNASSDDPLRHLDPTLRDFLAKESPVKYSPSKTQPQTEQTSIPVSAPEHQPIPEKQSRETGADHNSKAPPQSLFQDGRYAHLWSTYRPLNEIEAEYKSDAEKIMDVLEGYKQRKAEIGRAALENCALEQWDVNECFRNGGISSRLTMCRDENKKFDRCYTIQAKFLKALGYLSTYDRPPEIDEKIQMHADTLYHRMLEQEAAIEAAKTEGRPIPSFPPLVTAPITPASDTSNVDPSQLSASVQDKLKKRLVGLSGEEREIEERAIKAEIQAGQQVSGHLDNIYKKQEEEKRIRKEQGRDTIGDKISSLFGR